MKKFIYIQRIQILFPIIFLFFLMLPRLTSALRPLDDAGLTGQSPSSMEQPEGKSDGHLQPINELQLEDLSPSLTAPESGETPDAAFDRKMQYDFENSICFKKCHRKNDFHPSGHTAKQWRLLIEADGHAIFEEIKWAGPQEKEEILNYLLRHAKDSKPGAAGIGVW